MGGGGVVTKVLMYPLVAPSACVSIYQATITGLGESPHLRRFFSHTKENQPEKMHTYCGYFLLSVQQSHARCRLLEVGMMNIIQKYKSVHTAVVVNTSGIRAVGARLSPARQKINSYSMSSWACKTAMLDADFPEVGIINILMVAGETTPAPACYTSRNLEISGEKSAQVCDSNRRLTYIRAEIKPFDQTGLLTGPEV